MAHERWNLNGWACPVKDWTHGSYIDTVTRPRLALDLSDFRGFGPSGQSRYATDLVEGLVRLQPDADFVVLQQPGVLRDPLTTLGQGGSWWQSVAVASFEGRGAYYRRQVALAATLATLRVRLVHAVRETVPWLAPCPIVATAFDVMYEMFPEYKKAIGTRSYRINRWAVRRRARRVICISRSTARDIRERWAVPAERLDVVQLGTRLGRAETVSTSPSLANSWSRTLSDPVIVSPYNLEPRKNLSTLCEAAALLRGRYPGLTLVLFGAAALTPEREAKFETCLRDLSLGGAVVRPGILNDEALAAIYKRATVFAFPSLYEGFGLPVLEAMACGGCVVARSASAMPEVVGNAGVLLETADPEVLADGIGHLIDNPELRSKLGAAARERAASFTIERMASLTFASYEAALRKTTPAHALSLQAT